MAANIPEIQVLEKTREYIESNDPNYDIFKLKDITFNQEYTPSCPHIINKDMPRPIFRSLSVAQLRKIVYSDIIKVMDEFGLVMCGGFLYKLFVKELKYDGIFDIDLFIVDANKDQKYLSEKVDGAIRKLVDRKQCTYIKLSRRVIELSVQIKHGNFVDTVKIQIILRVYDSISQILHGFDLGSSAIAFDGKEVYLTSAGKFAYEYGFNIVSMDRCSDSYEYRLKKYFKRGFGIIMPNFRLDAEKNATILDYFYNYLFGTKYNTMNIELSKISIKNATIDNNSIKVDPKNFKTSYTRKSDYDDGQTFNSYDVKMLANYNAELLASDDADKIDKLQRIEVPEWGNQYIDAHDRSKLAPKIFLKPLDTLQSHIMKNIIAEISNEDPNAIMQKYADQIIRVEKNKLVNYGYSFDYIKADNLQYGMFNPHATDPAEWYGKHYTVRGA